MHDTTTLRVSTPFFSRHAHLVARGWSRLRREFRIRKAIRDLQHMPEHLLRDIGLTPSEIVSVVRYGVADQTRRRRPGP
jgi:uncharacterized protein YjiS (DUF1127 family)